MTPEKLFEAASVISEVSKAFASMPEDKEEAVSAALACTLANMYIVELAKHLSKGMDIYDACLITVKGETPLENLGVPASKISLFNLLRPRTSNE